MRRDRVAGLLIAVLLGAAACGGGGGGVGAPAASPGWTTVWGDSFDGPAGSPIDTRNWLSSTGTGYQGGATNWGTGEIEVMTNSTENAQLDGSGRLAITPIRDGSGRWTSARVETRRTDFQPPAGGVLRVEASIQQPDVTGPEALGYWSAFWMLGGPARPVGATNWPGVGEIDIMEVPNGLASVFGTMHCGIAPGGPCGEPNGIGSGKHPVPGQESGFHTYAVEWDRSVQPQAIRWYVDGTQYHAVTAAQVDAQTWKNATDHGFFVILNVAIGGSFPTNNGGVQAPTTKSGAPMLVDKVTVSSRTP
jgi:beta-glucanase (GH16 family)